MNSLRYLCFIVCLPICAYCQSISEVISNEIRDLNVTWGYRITASIINEGPIISLPNEKIQLGLSEIDKICANQNSRIKQYVVKFIVAHEFAHQIQYYRYRNEPKYLNNDLVTKTLLETQADVLAGLMFVRNNPDLLSLLVSERDFVNEVFQEIFKVALILGSKENTLGTHPSKRDRMLAVRLGLTNGLSFNYDQAVKSNPQLFVQQFGLTPEIFKKEMENQFYFLDLLKNEDMVDWAQRQSKKIVNYDRKIATDIVLTTPTPERHFFYTSIDSPFVYYDLTYKNIGFKSVYTEMEVYVALINRENPNSGEFFRKLNVNHYKFYLKPGDSYKVSGRLNWLKNDSDVEGLLEIRSGEMPRIIYPSVTSVDAVYSCEYVVTGNSEIPQSSVRHLELGDSDKEISFSNYFNSIYNSFLMQDDNIIQCIGEVNYYTENTLEYLASFQYIATSKTTVLTDSNRNIKSIILELDNLYPNINIVINEYEIMLNQLKKYLEGYSIDEDQEGQDKWVTFTGNGIDIYLEMIIDNDQKEYKIYLDIMPEVNY